MSEDKPMDSANQMIEMECDVLAINGTQVLVKDVATGVCYTLRGADPAEILKYYQVGARVQVYKQTPDMTHRGEA